LPFKSKAQERRFRVLLREGKITQATFDEWDRGTSYKRLPEHTSKKAKRRKR